MKRLYVPPLPEVAPTVPQPDTLLEKFRQDTIKGKKVVSKPRNPTDSAVDPDINFVLINIAPTSDGADCGIDFDCDP